MFDTTIFGIGSSTTDHRATWMIIQIHSWLSYYDFIWFDIGLFEHLTTALKSEPISFPDKDPLFRKLVGPAEALRKTSPAQPVKSSMSRPPSGNRLLRWSQKRSGARSAPISSCTVPGFCGATCRRVPSDPVECSSVSLWFFSNVEDVQGEICRKQLYIIIYILFTVSCAFPFEAILGKNRISMYWQFYGWNMTLTADISGIEYSWGSPSLKQSIDIDWSINIQYSVAISEIPSLNDNIIESNTVVIIY
jgi:hypothetical protein